MRGNGQEAGHRGQNGERARDHEDAGGKTSTALEETFSYFIEKYEDVEYLVIVVKIVMY